VDEFASEMAKLAQSAPPNAISLYNEHVAVISEIKRSQWQITNCVILLFAGMLALRADIRAAIPADLLLGGYFWTAGDLVQRCLDLVSTTSRADQTTATDLRCS
jgi:hypothetical protein